MNSCYRQEFTTEEGAHRCEELVDKLNTMFIANIRRDTVRDTSMTKDDLCKFVAGVLDDGIAQFSLEYRSVKTSIN